MDNLENLKEELFDSQDSYGTECAHERADEILCELSFEIGCSEMVKIYKIILNGILNYGNKNCKN